MLDASWGSCYNVLMTAMSVFPPKVATVMSACLDLADEWLPGRIEGLYLVGSVALDDFQPGQS